MLATGLVEALEPENLDLFHNAKDRAKKFRGILEQRFFL
jgi:hypothetical protein